MHRTIFDTPGVNSLLRQVSALGLKVAGWRVEGALPPQASRCVLIAAPHTSNWDLPLTLMAAFRLNLRPYWMGKAQIFRFPFGALMRWLGGIAVNRERHNNLVASSAETLKQADGPLQLIVPPEGTRAQVRHWKTGFYFIAQAAGVPVVMAYIDYADRRIGIGPLFHPTGDVERDLAAIKAFYAPFRGRKGQRIDAG
jgi:1-acyl-sn-glycerol-3-phosphate acyltransferase